MQHNFFKIVVAEKIRDGKPELLIASFAMPNAEIPSSMPLETFLLPLSVVEELAGIQFYPGLLDNQARAKLDALEKELMRDKNTGSVTLLEACTMLHLKVTAFYATLASPPGRC